jgi:hypothetical protein
MTGFCPDRFGCYKAQHAQAAGSAGQSFEEKVIEAIESLWARVQLLNISYEKRLRLVGEIEIATELNIGAKGSPTSGDQLRRKLRDEGIKDRFPGEKQWCRAFIRSVIEELSKTRQSVSGFSRQQIV